MRRGNVLVTDGEQRAALAVVRSLGRAGWTVVVASHVRRSLAGGSRYSCREYQVPAPLAEPDRFATAIRGLARDGQVRWVLPITDAAMAALLPERAGLMPARIPYPDRAVVEQVGDKAQVMSVARECGIAVPYQIVVSSPADLAGVTLPCYLKPSRSVAARDGTRVRLTPVLVRDQAALEETAATLPAGAWPLLAQHRIVGPGVGVFLLRWAGRTRAAFAHRRLREKPPGGGVSVYRESMAAPPDLLARTERLLAWFDWEGPAMVEYKMDRDTGTAFIMEINGRYWGSLQLAIDAGVDFPRLHLALAEGEEIGPPPAWRAGVRSRWELGDLDHLLSRLRRSPDSLGLPPGSPGRFRTLLDVCKIRPGDRCEVCRVDDLLPFLRELRTWPRGGSA